MECVGFSAARAMHCPNVANCSLAQQQVFIPSSTHSCPECGAELNAPRGRWHLLVPLVLSVVVFGGGHWLLKMTGSGGAASSGPAAPPPTTVPAPQAQPITPPAAAQTGSLIAKADLAADAIPHAPGAGLAALVPAFEAAAKTFAPAEHDEAVARMAFRWIARHIAYDVKALRTAKMPAPDPDKVLASGKAVCEGYAAVFTSLCQELGVDAVTIGGRSHTEVEEIGAALDPNTPGHAWNAAKLHGRWTLLDVTWAAGKVDANQFHADFNAFWYDTPPAQFIRSHWPDDAKWQMLAQPVDYPAFAAQAVVAPRYFELAIEDKSARVPGPDGRLDARSGFLKLHAIKGAQLQFASSKQGQSADTDLSGTETPLPDGTSMHALDLASVPAGHDVLRVFGSAAANASKLGMMLEFRVEHAAAKGSPPTFFAGYHKRKAQLLEPLTDTLRDGERKTFRVKVPGADNVRIQQNGNDYFLHQTASGEYQATIAVSKGELIIYGKFPNSGNQIEGLVKFIVQR